MNHSLNRNHWIFLKIFSLMVVKIRMEEMRKDKRKTHLILTKWKVSTRCQQCVTSHSSLAPSVAVISEVNTLVNIRSVIVLDWALLPQRTSVGMNKFILSEYQLCTLQLQAQILIMKSCLLPCCWEKRILQYTLTDTLNLIEEWYLYAVLKLATNKNLVVILTYVKAQPKCFKPAARY